MPPRLEVGLEMGSKRWTDIGKRYTRTGLGRLEPFLFPGDLGRVRGLPMAYKGGAIQHQEYIDMMRYNLALAYPERISRLQPGWSTQMINDRS